MCGFIVIFVFVKEKEIQILRLQIWAMKHHFWAQNNTQFKQVYLLCSHKLIRNLSSFSYIHVSVCRRKLLLLERSYKRIRHRENHQVYRIYNTIPMLTHNHNEPNACSTLGYIVYTSTFHVSLYNRQI